MKEMAQSGLSSAGSKKILQWREHQKAVKLMSYISTSAGEVMLLTE
jgi:hypothetical protein